MDNAILKYLDTSGTVHTATVDVLSVRGFNDPDDVQFFPAVEEQYVDGTTSTKFTGFRRVITAQVLTVDDHTTDDFIAAFLLAANRSITYQSGNVVGLETWVVPSNEKFFEDVWANGFKLARIWTVKVVENFVRQTWPSGAPPIYEDMAYTIYNLKVTGSQTAPQTFTTNSGALAADSSGNPYPVISLLSNVVHLSITPKQDRKINQVGGFTQVGDNISFQLALSDGGNDSPDGYSYCDLSIILEPIA